MPPKKSKRGEKILHADVVERCEKVDWSGKTKKEPREKVRGAFLRGPESWGKQGEGRFGYHNKNRWRRKKGVKRAQEGGGRRESSNQTHGLALKCSRGMSGGSTPKGEIEKCEGNWGGVAKGWKKGRGQKMFIMNFNDAREPNPVWEGSGIRDRCIFQVFWGIKGC